MTLKLVPVWVWLLVAALVVGGAYGAGYYKARVTWEVKLEVERAKWETREDVYKKSAETADKNLADEKKTRKAAEDSVAAMIKASAAAVRDRDEARATAAALSSRLGELEAIQDAEAKPVDCPGAFAQLAAHIAALNGAIYATSLSPPGGDPGPGGVLEHQIVP